MPRKRRRISGDACGDRKALERAPENASVASWCPHCGPDVPVDDDGCCTICGSDATGDGAEMAHQLLWMRPADPDDRGQRGRNVTRTLTLPLRVVSEANAHGHWRTRQRRAKAQRAAVCLAWRTAGLLEQRMPLSVTLTRIGPRTLDDDNLAGAFKHVRDEIARMCGFDDRIGTWRYAQERGAPGIRIEIEWPEGTVA